MNSDIKWCGVPTCLLGRWLIMSGIVFKSVSLRFTQSGIVFCDCLDASFTLWLHLVSIIDEIDLYPVIVSHFYGSDIWMKCGLTASSTLLLRLKSRSWLGRAFYLHALEKIHSKPISAVVEFGSFSCSTSN